MCKGMCKCVCVCKYLLFVRIQGKKTLYYENVGRL